VKITLRTSLLRDVERLSPEATTRDVVGGNVLRGVLLWKLQKVGIVGRLKDEPAPDARAEQSSNGGRMVSESLAKVVEWFGAAGFLHHAWDVTGSRGELIGVIFGVSSPSGTIPMRSRDVIVAIGPEGLKSMSLSCERQPGWDEYFSDTVGGDEWKEGDDFEGMWDEDRAVAWIREMES